MANFTVNINMNVKYKGQRYIIRPGMLIRVDARPAIFSAAHEPEPKWVNAKVLNLLGTQFSVERDDEPGEWRLVNYTSVGDTWIPRL